MSFSLTAQLELRPGAQIVAFDSNTREKSYRVELLDGRHFQINEKLQHLLEALRTPLNVSALAAEFQQRSGQTVAVDQLQQLVVSLVEQGVVIETGKEPIQPAKTQQTASAYLSLHYRRDLLSPAVLAPMARMLQGCFNRRTAAILLSLILGAHILAYRELGFPPNLAMENVSWPLLYVLMLVSILFHELGHLAACHRWQCPHGPLGFGLYFFTPVFYVDVTAAWRLNRRQRAIVDLGGVYIQLLFVPLALLLFWATEDPTYLMLIAMLDLLVLGNFEPFMKLDGYWLLSDLTGVPNLHARTGEALKSFWGWTLWRLGRRSVAPPPSVFSQWSGWVRVVLSVYIVLSVVLWPLLLIGMVPLVIDAVMIYPALWSTAFAVLIEASTTGNVSAILTSLNDLFLPTMTLLGAGFMLKMLWNQARKARKAQKGQAMQVQPA